MGDPPFPCPPPQHVLLSLTYPELCWELVGAVGQDGDPPGQDGDPAEPPQLWLEFDGDHEGAPVNRLLRVFSPQVRPPARGNWGALGGRLGGAGGWFGDPGGEVGGFKGLVWGPWGGFGVLWGEEGELGSQGGFRGSQGGSGGPVPCPPR